MVNFLSHVFEIWSDLFFRTERGSEDSKHFTQKKKKNVSRSLFPSKHLVLDRALMTIWR